MGITIDPKQDERGILSRIWEENSRVKNFRIIEASHVTNPVNRTLRGLHYQSRPYAENKIIQCVTGKVFDVILDLRSESKTYKKHLEVEIGPKSLFQGVFVPEGCAHGYMTLQSNSNLIYFMDQVYLPERSKGVNWEDPKLSVKWPNKPILISQQDLNWPRLDW
jgi:dTDP-4-dehydrorhamnose 3,5-epimerase